MKQILRYSFVALLTMVGLNLHAQGVTIDFDNDYATLFPTLKGVSSSSGENQHDGDFTVTTTSTAVSGFTVTVSAADEGNSNANRIWSGAPRLRMYSGTFTVSGKGIKRIDFTGHNSNFNLSTNTGTLNGKVWTGEADEVVFNVSRNTQINKIVINGEGSNDTPSEDKTNYGTADAPITVAAALKILSSLDANVNTEESYVKGKISKIDEINLSNGNATFYISDDGSTTTQLEVFRAKYLEKKNFTAENQIAVGDEVIISGKMVNYKSSNAATEDPVTPEFTSGCFIYSLNGNTKDSSPVNQGSGSGTLADPYDCIAANYQCLLLESGAVSEEVVYIKGKIVSVKYLYDVEHGTGTFYISNDGTTANQFQVYSAYYLANKPYQEGQTNIAVGDDVIICGKITNYNGTPETSSKKAYLYSLNGTTAGIEALNVGEAQGAVYNLAGQRVEKAVKGLYIKNGKKFIVK